MTRSILTRQQARDYVRQRLAEVPKDSLIGRLYSEALADDGLNLSRPRGQWTMFALEDWHLAPRGTGIRNKYGRPLAGSSKIGIIKVARRIRTYG